MRKIVILISVLLCIFLFLFFINKFEKNYYANSSDTMKLKFPDFVWTYYTEEPIKKTDEYPFYLVRYVDSTECIPCKLGYQELKRLYDAVNSKGKVMGIKLIFDTTDKNLVRSIAKSENIIDPIAIDSTSKMRHLNKFLRETSDEYILIDKNNNILAIGDPMTEEDAKKQYDKIFSPDIAKPDELTDGEISSRILELGKIKNSVKKDTTIFLYNRGSRPLVIYDVITPCGCLKVSYKRNVIQPRQKGKCIVSVTPSKGLY